MSAPQTSGDVESRDLRPVGRQGRAGKVGVAGGCGPRRRSGGLAAYAAAHVRAVARGLARQGKVVILRHNKPADPDDFKGVYRLRLPLEGEGAGEGEPTAT